MVGRLIAHRLLAVALCLLCVGAPPPASAADGTTASGIGARPCRAFSDALERDSAIALDAYVSWSQGFIAGFNWSNARQVKVEVDAAGIINWLGQYCATNPQARVFTGVQELIRLNAR
ncbi:MAG: hypothetical protein AB7Q81_00180 [Gammaproteobacteria bacterium]